MSIINYVAEPTISKFHQSDDFVRMIIGPIGCVDEDTEFLSPTGWRKISEYREGLDLVGTVEPEKGGVFKFSFHRPSAYIKGEAESSWYGFEGKGLDMKLSSVHRVPYYENGVLKESNALALNKLYLRKFFIPDTWTRDSEPDSSLSQEQIGLLVALSLGDVVFDGQCIEFNLNFAYQLKRLIYILDILGIPYRKIVCPHCLVTLRVSRFSVAATLGFPVTERYRTLDKSYPWFSASQDELFSLVEELREQKLIFDCPVEGVVDRKEKGFHSTVKGEVDIVQLALHGLGYSTRYELSASGHYGIRWNEELEYNTPPSFREDQTVKWVETTEDGEYQYCFTMPSGYWVARRNGNIFITGNSGKSVGCTMEILQRALKQKPFQGVRKSRYAVIRNTFPELKSTTIKTFQDWIPHSICHFTWDAPITARIVLNDIGDGTALDLEVIFLALDKPADVKKLLSLELTGAWINEAKEISKATLDMLTGRVDRYPSKREGGASWIGVFCDTNPPDDDHWIYRLFEGELPRGYSLFHQPPALLMKDGEYIENPSAENITNHTSGYEYYFRQLPGKDPEWIKVYIMGQYGSVQDGKPVYPEYNDVIHYTPNRLEVYDSLPLYISFDFGLTPACVIGQVSPRGQLRILHELVSVDMGIRQFARDIVKPFLSLHFPYFQIHSFGDPAGTQRAQSNERTCMQELKDAGIPTLPAVSNDFTMRREAVASYLTGLIDGEPKIIISENCPTLRKAMNGGYKYRRVQIAGDERYKDKPDKNKFSHVADALQYLCLGVMSSMRKKAKGIRVTRRDEQPVSATAGY